MGLMEKTVGVGRLIVSLDDQINSPSIQALKCFIDTKDGEIAPQMITGSRIEVVKDIARRWPKSFYNHNDFMPPARVARLLPWAEVWVVQDGEVWELIEKEKLTLVSNLENQALDLLSFDRKGGVVSNTGGH